MRSACKRRKACVLRRQFFSRRSITKHCHGSRLMFGFEGDAKSWQSAPMGSGARDERQCLENHVWTQRTLQLSSIDAALQTGIGRGPKLWMIGKFDSSPRPSNVVRFWVHNILTKKHYQTPKELRWKVQCLWGSVQRT